MKPRPVLSLVLTAGLILSGCATNPYSKFYVSALNGQPVSATRGLIPHAGESQVYPGRDLEEDWAAMTERGFALVGYSSFNAAAQSPSRVKAQGKSLQAEVVLLYSRYTNTVSGTIPYVVQGPPQQVTTEQSGTAYGSGGWALYSGMSTTTVPGRTSVSNIPYSVNRYDHFASYWVRTEPPRLGLSVRDLTPQERVAIQKNIGVYTRAVIKGSPAFGADLLRGDILTGLGDAKITDTRAFQEAIDRYAGQEVMITFLRFGQQRSVRVTLNSTTPLQQQSSQPVNSALGGPASR